VFSRREGWFEVAFLSAFDGGEEIAYDQTCAVPVCDVSLSHTSHISDEEEYRFQMPVAVYGHELERHSGGRAYHWGPRDITFRRSVQMRLVNVGPARLVERGGPIGYPVCLVCAWRFRSARADYDQLCSGCGIGCCDCPQVSFGVWRLLYRLPSDFQKLVFPSLSEPTHGTRSRSTMG
jgi:hypothetical protein